MFLWIFCVSVLLSSNTTEGILVRILVRSRNLWLVLKAVPRIRASKPNSRAIPDMARWRCPLQAPRDRKCLNVAALDVPIWVNSFLKGHETIYNQPINQWIINLLIFSSFIRCDRKRSMNLRNDNPKYIFFPQCLVKVYFSYK